MARVIFIRTLSLIMVLIAVSLVVFSVLHFLPGDPALQILGPFASQEEVTILREQLGLDLPLIKQYWRFFTGAIRGDLGISYTTKFPVAQLLWPAFQRTLILAVTGALFSAIVGIATGVLSACKFGTFWDYLVTSGVVLGISMPGFWFGTMLIVIFSQKLGWLPSGGYGLGKHLILPALCLGIIQAAQISQFTRGSLLEVLLQDYVRTAKAKGLAGYIVLWKHAFRNALIPVITVMGVQFGTLLSGAVTIEVVFSWPGVGKMIVDAALARDYPVVIGGALAIAFSFILVNYVTDIFYGVINPRVRRA